MVAYPETPNISTFKVFPDPMGHRAFDHSPPPRHLSNYETRPFQTPLDQCQLQLYFSASTMELSGQSLPLTPQGLKFGKCISTSSMGTEADLPQGGECLQRKISDEQKQRFINLITVQNYNMKEAARIALMSYSTAKKIFTRFRKALRLKTLKREVRTEGRGQCAYVDADGMQGRGVARVAVVSTIAGKEQMRRENVICIFKTDC